MSSPAFPALQKPAPLPKRYGPRAHSGIRDHRLSNPCAKALAARLPAPHVHCWSAFCSCECHRAK